MVSFLPSTGSAVQLSCPINYLTIFFLALSVPTKIAEKRGQWSNKSCLLLQVNNFEKDSFVWHFIKEFELKFYMIVQLCKRIFKIFVNIKAGKNGLSEHYWPVILWNSYSCNKITKTCIQISRQNWNGFFSNISHQRMI